MKTEIKTLPGSRVELRVQLDAQDVDALYGKVYAELSKRGAVRGFRPGKAPKALIRRQVGADTIRGAAWAEFVQEKLPDLLEEAKLEIIETPEVPELDEVAFNEGEDTEVTIGLTVRPEATLPGYKGIKLMRPVAEVTDEKVEKALAELQDSFGEEVDAERDAVEDGDIVDATVRVIIEGQEAEAQAREQSITVGGGRYDPAIDDELKGHSVGQTVKAEKVLPDDYDDENLRGKTLTIEATINAIRTRKLPEITDEFAREVDAEKYEFLDDLKADIRERIGREQEKAAGDALEAQVIDYLQQNTTLDLPQSLLDRATAEEQVDFSRALQMQGLTVEAMQELTETDPEEFRARLARQAESKLRTQIILDALVEAESIEASADEIDAEVERYAAAEGVDVALLRQAVEVQEGLLDRMTARVKTDKALAALIDAAEVEDVPEDMLGARMAAIRVAREAGAQQTEATDEPSDEPETSSASDADAPQDDAATDDSPEETAAQDQ